MVWMGFPVDFVSSFVRKDAGNIVDQRKWMYAVDLAGGLPVLSVTTYLRRQMGMTKWKAFRGGLGATCFWAGCLLYGGQNTERDTRTWVCLNGPLYTTPTPDGLDQWLAD
jgi:hypothetical protein